LRRKVQTAVLALLLSLSAAAAAEASCRALDGDTYICRGERIRLENADSPELHGRCDAELEAARAARAFAQTALDGAREIKIEIGRRAHDRYGRTLAHILVDGRDLGELLVGIGLARPYHGERRRGWCE
jgi:endonuclease YncB( thermonuclease family)